MNIYCTARFLFSFHRFGMKPSFTLCFDIITSSTYLESLSKDLYDFECDDHDVQVKEREFVEGIPFPTDRQNGAYVRPLLDNTTN